MAINERRLARVEVAAQKASQAFKGYKCFTFDGIAFYAGVNVAGVPEGAQAFTRADLDAFEAEGWFLIVIQFYDASVAAT